jgi:RHS repeat-associated protein
VESGGTLAERYFRGVGTDELVAAWLQDGDGKTKPFLFHHDQVNSVRAVTGHNGGTTQSIKYAAFGTVQSNAGSSPSRLKYTGREDDGAGLYYYRARYYDPAIGRFVSEDPLGFEAGINFYSYVGNNPVNGNDPSGHAAMQVGGAIVGAVGGLVVQGGIDLARGRLSSFADYAGSFTGGAAGGAAAVTCGPACAGATAGAVSSATTQGINWAQGQAASAWNFITDTALGAVGGKVAGTVVPYLFKTALPNLVGVGTANQIKGQIGETMSAIGLIGTGRSFSTQVENGVIRNGQASTFDFGLSGYRNFVETKWGTATLSSAQREAAQIPGTSLSMHQWGYPTVSGITGSSFAAGSAGGGFLLYPNKANTNMMQSVYSK